MRNLFAVPWLTLGRRTLLSMGLAVLVVVGVSYAELISRLPNLTHRYWLNIALALVVLVVMVAVLVLTANALPAPRCGRPGHASRSGLGW